MTTLNNRLQLALLNRKKGKNALEKGFTLVELMIVIVIVGVLSAVALPNFLGQTKKARATEAQSAISAAYKNAQQLYLEDPSTIATTISDATGAITSATATSGNTSTAFAGCLSGLAMKSSANMTEAACSLNPAGVLNILVKTPDGKVYGNIDLSDGSVTKPVFTEE